MITFHTFCGAVRAALVSEFRATQAAKAALAQKRQEQAARDAEWRAELARRDEAERDDDGSRAEARRLRAEQQERDQLAFMTETIRRRQARLS